jgi:hypothetical protein
MNKVRTIVCSVIAFTIAFFYFSNNKKEGIVQDQDQEPEATVQKFSHQKNIKLSPQNNKAQEVASSETFKEYYAEMGDHTFNLNLKNDQLEGTFLVVIGGIKLDLNIIGGVGVMEIDGHTLQARLEKISTDTIIARVHLSGEQLASPSNFTVELLEINMFNANKKANEDNAYNLSMTYPNDESHVEYQDESFQAEGAEFNPSFATEPYESVTSPDWGVQSSTGDTYTTQTPEYDPEAHPQAYYNFNDGTEEYQN